jgi:hypothetical protein
VHDFNPGINSNGLFWILQVPDDAVEITDDTLTISLANLPVVDQFQFPGGSGNNLGIAGVPAKVSFDITYTKIGAPRHVRPTSTDPLSPLNWAGKMWMATNSGTFSLSYDDGTFSAEGRFTSSGNFGEIGMERNGSFLRQDEEIDEADTETFPLDQNQNPSAAPKRSETNALQENGPKLKGRLPVKALIHEP